MVPDRLAFAWSWRLPGPAMLNTERFAAALGLPEEHEVAEAEPAGDDAALVELLRGVRRRGGAVRAVLRSARESLLTGDRARAADDVVAARRLAAPLADPSLEAWVDLVASMVALADGALALAANLSIRAERGALRAGDEGTFLAVWWSRASHALRRGHAADGLVMLRWMQGWLERAAPSLADWSRCFEGADLLDEGKPREAITCCAPLLSGAAETAAGWAAGSVVSSAFLAIDRPDDAARIAVATLDHAAAAPAAVRALCYVAASRAFAAADLEDAAGRCAAVAASRDPGASTDPSALEVDGAGVELRLL
jgi:hypothetical protein